MANDDLEDVSDLSGPQQEDNSDLGGIQVPHTALGNAFPTYASDKPTYDPTDSEGEWYTGHSKYATNTAVAAGRELNQTRLGAKQWFAPFLDKLTEMSSAQPGVIPTSAMPQGPHSRAVNQEIEETNTYDAPSRNVPGNALGTALGRGMQTALIPGGAMGQVAGQGLLSYFDPVSGNPTPEQEEHQRKVNSAVGAGSALFGAGLGRVAGAAFRPFKNQLSAAGQQAINVLKKNGIDQFDVAQGTGNSAAQAWKHLVESHPFFKGSNFTEEVQRPLVTHQILNRYMGGDAPETLAAQNKIASNAALQGKPTPDFSGMSPAKVKAIKTGANEAINGFFRRNPVTLDSPAPHIDMSTVSHQFQPGTMATFRDALDTIARNANDEGLGIKKADKLLGIINNLKYSAGTKPPMMPINPPGYNPDFFSGGTSVVPGDVRLATSTGTQGGIIPSNVLQSTLEELSEMSAGGNRVEKQWAGKLSEVIKQAAKGQAAYPEDFEGFARAKANLNALHYGMKARGADNNINLTKLATRLSKTDAPAGAGPEHLQNLWEVAQAGKQVFGSKLGNSGTATRLLGPALLTGAVGAAEPLTRGDFKGALKRGSKFAAYGLGAPLLGSSLLYKAIPRNYAIWSSQNPLMGALNKAAVAGGAGWGASAPNYFNSPDDGKK